MKVLVVAVFICVIGEAMSNMDAKFKELTTACVEETGIGEDAWQNVEDQKLDDPKMPDFLFCAYKKFNFLNDNGEYQIEPMKAALTEMFGEEIANKVIEDCTKDAKATGPESAMALTKCSNDIIPKIEQ